MMMQSLPELIALEERTTGSCKINMKKLWVAAMTAILGLGGVQAATLHVDLNSPNPEAPYASWSGAATSIHDAVAASKSGDVILVTNELYLIASEILVTNDVRIESVHGPDLTMVDGDAMVRCFNLGGTHAVLSGLTITNGYTSSEGGGVYAESHDPILTNCVVVGNFAQEFGGGVRQCTVYDSIVISNGTAKGGGGIKHAHVYNSTVADNTSSLWGGGTYGSVLYYCDVYGNQAPYGGAAQASTRFYFCTIHDNVSSGNGGAVSGGVKVYNSRVFNNHSSVTGGAAHNSFCYNSLIYSNSTDGTGGGCSNTDTINCTVFYNQAAEGGGIWMDYKSNGRGECKNSIICENTSLTMEAQNIFMTTSANQRVSYSCSPDVVHGTEGNITNAPLFVDEFSGNFYLMPESPCIDAGIELVDITNDLAATPRPIDGNADGSTVPDMGAYEYASPLVDSDGDGQSDHAEWIANTDITDDSEWFHISTVSSNVVVFKSSEARQYTLLGCTNLVEGIWEPVPGQIDVMGSGGEHALSGTGNNSATFYKVEVEIP